MTKNTNNVHMTYRCFPPQLKNALTCILLIIISCSTIGCVSPVKFMVPSSMMKVWIDGKEACSSGSHSTDSICGMLSKRGTSWI